MELKYHEIFLKQHTVCLISVLRKDTLNRNISATEIAGPQIQSQHRYRGMCRPAQTTQGWPCDRGRNEGREGWLGFSTWGSLKCAISHSEFSLVLYIWGLFRKLHELRHKLNKATYSQFSFMNSIYIMHPLIKINLYLIVSMHSTLVIIWQHRLVKEPELPQKNASHWNQMK